MTILPWLYKTGFSSFKTMISLTCWDNCQRSMTMRLALVAIGFSIFFSSIAYRLVSLVLEPHEQRSQLATKQVARKEITDRNGTLLAVNIPTSSLFANPQHMVNIQKDVAKLVKALPGLDGKKLLSELDPKKTFVWIKHDITPKEHKAINDLGIAGLYFEKEDRRLYTYGSLLSHVIGYVGRQSAGLAGLEKSYDKFLQSSDSADKSKSLALTIDVRVQNIVAEELDKIMEATRAPAAIGIVVDPNSGEIIALVSKPDFDPHNPAKASPEALFNNATLGVFEMGSVMKTLTMAIGFDTGTITTSDAYNLSGLRVSGFQVKDAHPVAGWHSVPEIFLHSSNIGVTQIALETGQSAFQSYYKKLGLLDKLQLELPECSSPLYPRNMNWSNLTLTTMSYGYGISISPMHFIQAALPSVNGGYLHPLTLIKKDASERPEPLQVLKASTSESMLKIMRLVVTEGTGRKAAVKGQLIAGKTGTAEIQEGRHYVKNARRSSMLAAVPAIDPKYVVYVMLNKPQPTKESYGFAGAGWNAAPTAGAIISRIAALYGMKNYDEDDPEIVEKLHLELLHDNKT
jgi:cell division protein FtsI (penicillin-binding protein 3)